jgi:uncharacterized protein
MSESMFTWKEKIKSEDELRSMMGESSELVKRKVIPHLDEHCQDFISRSPFLVISTSDELGYSDVSPRGDQPGFALILDQNHLVIPERPGNKKNGYDAKYSSQPKGGFTVSHSWIRGNVESEWKGYFGEG